MQRSFFQALDFESLDPFFGVSKQGPCLTAREKEGNESDLYNLNLLAKLLVFLLRILFSLLIAAMAAMATMHHIFYLREEEKRFFLRTSR